ncbi:disulfide oxidoreductase [Terrilactibacillus sp. S3-3]|nr:disulfide oxidoreductase [Terrilactibacillus sp. S3-3]
MMKAKESKLNIPWLYLAWIVSIAATLGSLFMSDVLGYDPCKLCWFQRIFMYPLTIILAIAAFRGDRTIAVYVLPLSVIGGLFSIIHYSEQKLGFFRSICRVGVSCTRTYFEWFGFVTIPLLALIAFTLITIFMAIDLRKAVKEQSAD